MEARARTMTDECCHYGGSVEGWSVSKIELTNCHSLAHSLRQSERFCGIWNGVCPSTRRQIPFTRYQILGTG